MGISNLGSLLTFHKNNPQGLAWLEVQQCLNAFPKLWVKLLSERDDWQLNSYTNELINIGNHKWQNGAYISTRQIRQLITKQSETPIDKVDLLRKHQLDVDLPDTTPTNPFEVPYLCSAYMKVLQYKILHRAFTTRSKLFLYKIIDSPLCPFCEESDDNFEHALYKCDLSKHTWSNLQSWLDKYDIPIQLHIPNIIMGVNERLPYSQLINTILVRIKHILISPKEGRRAMTVDEIENVVLDQLQVERMSSCKSNHKQKISYLKLQKRWGHLLNILS